MTVLAALGAMMAGNAAAPATYATWNPSDKSANITLVGGDLVGYRSGGAAEYNSARATLPLTGKRYWEASVNFGIAGGEIIGVGVADAAMPLSGSISSGWLGHDESNCGIWGPATRAYKANSIIYDGVDASIPVYMFVFAASTRALWIGRVGAGWFTGDPAEDTDPIAILPEGTYFPTFTVANTSTGITANFGASAFAGTVPAGVLSGVYE